MNCKKVGERLDSQKFAANRSSIQWQLQLYPNGRNKIYEGYISLYLKTDAAIKAEGIFKIVNNNGKQMQELNMGDIVFGDKSWGYHRYISRDFLLNPVNDLLISEKIIILCEITYNQSEATNQEIEKQEKNVLPRLEDEYEALLCDSKFSDISLISEGKSLKVHKCILAKRSSVFAAMFDIEMKEKRENIVEITDVKYDVLAEMIRFVYAGKVNNVDTLAGELAIAADKYALDGLKNLCEITMKKNLSIDNVIDCLQLADKLHMNELIKKAIEFVVENARDASEKQEFRALPHDIVCEIFSSMAKRK